MKKFLSVSVTCCPGSSLHEAHVYYTDDEAGLKLSFDLPYEQGMKELRKLEKRLGRPAALIVNRYNRDVSYKELFGYIDRE